MHQKRWFSSALLALGALSLGAAGACTVKEEDGNASNDAGNGGNGEDAGTGPSNPGSEDGGNASQDAAPDGPKLPHGAAMTSGTRIKGSWYETGDGLSTLAYLRDTQLDINCTWQTAADGELRCLPQSYDSTTYPRGHVYADASCTVPVLYRAASACPLGAKAFAAEVAPTCPSGTRVLAIGGPVPKPAQTYFVDPMGKCASSGAPGGGTYFALTEMPPSAFVGGTESVAVGSAELSPVAVLGNDGSVSFRSLRDGLHGVDCAFEHASDKTLRCLPTTTALLHDDFADSTCKTRAAASPASSCDGIQYAKSPPSGCPASVDVYGVGQRISQVFGQANCSISPVFGPDFHALGPIVPPTVFPAGQVGIASGTSRIRAHTVTSGAAVAIAKTKAAGVTLFDSQRNEECLPLPSTDGLTRCLPFPSDGAGVAFASSTEQAFFADATCTTTPVAVTITPNCQTPKYAFDVPGQCGQGSYGVHPITGARSAATIYVKAGAVCQATPVTPPVAVFDIGPAITPATFEQVTSAVH